MKVVSQVIVIFFSGFIFSQIVFGAERDPEKLFNDYCFTCHGTGWENAPVIGDDFAWEERREKGLELLIQNTINGINTMPPKGTCTDCTDKEITAVVKWLVGE